MNIAHWQSITLPKTNVEVENGPLEHHFPLQTGGFPLHINFRECILNGAAEFQARHVHAGGSVEKSSSARGVQLQSLKHELEVLVGEAARQTCWPQATISESKYV